MKTIKIFEGVISYSSFGESVFKEKKYQIMIFVNKLNLIVSRLILMIGVLILIGCKKEFPVNPEYISDGFDFPVGKPNAKGFYDAQPFGKNNHLGSDWNGRGGGNTDLGSPIYATSHGYVKSAKNLGGGWGSVIRIIHTLPNGKQYESVYAHCDKVLIKSNSFVKKGQNIATIGTCNGRYLAHLHFEIRNFTNMDIGGGYSWNTIGYMNPTKFINGNRELLN